MWKVWQLIIVAVVGIGVGLAVVGCDAASSTGKDKMGSDKMNDGKMGGDKMGGGKMDGGKMGGDKMDSGKMGGDKMGTGKMDKK